MNSMDSLGRLLLRCATAGLMLFYGVHKVLYGYDYIISVLTEKGLPGFLYLGVPVGEVIAPILLIIGIFTRLSSLVIAFTMVMSMYLAFGSTTFELNKYGGLTGSLNILFLFCGLVIALIGPGKYAVYKGNNRWLS